LFGSIFRIFVKGNRKKTMAKDIFHETVKIALQKDGWQIT